MILRIAAVLASCSLPGQSAATPAPQPSPTTAVAPQAADGTRTFQSRSNLFRVDLPSDWRQLAPAEVAAVARAVPQLPHDVGQNEPSLFYAVGPVDRWREGQFDGRYLYVVEQDGEWQIDDHLAERLATMWQQKGELEHVRYRIADVQQVTVGPERHDVVTCIRRAEPAEGPAQRSLDVYVPTGGRELTLCWTCWDADFERLLPSFRAQLATLGLARRARGKTTLGDRLWTPVVAGALVGTVLIVLYRRTRRRTV